MCCCKGQGEGPASAKKWKCKETSFYVMGKVLEVGKAQANEEVHGCKRTNPAGNFCKPVVQSYCSSSKHKPALKNWEPCLDLGALKNQICL